MKECACKSSPEELPEVEWSLFREAFADDFGLIEIA